MAVINESNAYPINANILTIYYFKQSKYKT